MLKHQQLKKKIFQLYEKYSKQLVQKLQDQNRTSFPTFVFNGSGCRQNSHFMKKPIFIIGVCSILFHLKMKQSLSIMITASHNPAIDNGVKVGYTSDKILPENIFKQIEQCLNCDAKFGQFLEDHLGNIIDMEIKDKSIYVGRDSRDSSPILFDILIGVIQLFKVNFVNIGVCSTPELFSFSNYLQNRKQPVSQLNINQLKQLYVKQVMQSFLDRYKKVSVLENRKILLDFSNGSGAISYLMYKSCIQQVFHVTEINNVNFSHPNFKCGADYYSKNWDIVLQSQYFAGFNQCFFFDGDSDRIIGKVQGLSKRTFDGNYFMVLFIMMMIKIKDKLILDKLIVQANFEQFTVYAVGTVIMNLGVKSKVLDLGLKFIQTDVGTLNLYRQVIRLKGVSVFFQPNGHGGIYFSPTCLQEIERLSNNHSDNYELNLLKAINLILKNNSKGYGLHNMLMFYLAKNYLKLSSFESLFTFTQQKSKNLRLLEQQDSKFKNGGAKNQLIQPQQVKTLINDTANKKQYENYEILVRKSVTEKCLIRINVQGVDQFVCLRIIEQIQRGIQSFGHLKKK